MTFCGLILFLQIDVNSYSKKEIRGLEKTITTPIEFLFANTCVTYLVSHSFSYHIWSMVPTKEDDSLTCLSTCWASDHQSCVYSVQSQLEKYTKGPGWADRMMINNRCRQIMIIGQISLKACCKQLCGTLLSETNLRVVRELTLNKECSATSLIFH